MRKFDDMARPLKVHMFRDQKGATYSSCGKTHKYADTACKHNWPVENVTQDPNRVTCKRCLRMMAKAEVVSVPEGHLQEVYKDREDLQEWLYSEMGMADQMAALARLLLDRLGPDDQQVLVIPFFTVSDFALGQLALYDNLKEARKGRWNEVPLG